MENQNDLYTVSKKVLDKYKVTEQNLKRIQAIGPYDLSFVTNNLNEDLLRTGRTFSCEQAYPLRAKYGKADRRLATRLEEEFKRFCILTLVKPDVPHAPSGAIDMYWHFFILHTEQYIKFSESVWGDFKGDPKFRQHYPSNDQTRTGMLNAYNATRELYVDIFGEPRKYELDEIPGAATALEPRGIWVPKSDTSGDSYSGTIENTSYVE